jgi:glutathione S-transferase
MLKLYYSPGACSFAPHIILNEIGAPFATERVVLAEGAHLKPEYLAINPRGRVPTLIVGGETITENAAILTWLGQQDGRFFPVAGSLAAARASEWLAWLTSSVHISFAQIWRGSRFSDDAGQHDAIRARGLTTLAQQFNEIENKLGTGPFALGSDYSVVDPNLLTFYRWGNRVGFTMRQRFPAWTQHTERLLERDAVQRTITTEGIVIFADPDPWVASAPKMMTRERLAVFDRAWTEGDVPTLLAHMTDDGVYAASVGPEPGATYRGRAELEAGFRAMLEHDTSRVRHSGDSWIFGNHGVACWAFEENGRRIEGIDLFVFDGDRIRLKDAFRKTTGA